MDNSNHIQNQTPTQTTAATIQRRLNLILSTVSLKLDLVLQRDLNKLHRHDNSSTNDRSNQQPISPFLASICFDDPLRSQNQLANQEEQEQEEEHDDGVDRANGTHHPRLKRDEHGPAPESDDLMIILEHSSESLNVPTQTTFLHPALYHQLPQPTPSAPLTTTTSTTHLTHTRLTPFLPLLEPLHRRPSRIPLQADQAGTNTSSSTSYPRRKGKKKRKNRGGDGRMGKMMKGCQGVFDDRMEPGFSGEDGVGGGVSGSNFEGSQDQPRNNHPGMASEGAQGYMQQSGQPGQMIGDLMRWGPSLPFSAALPRFRTPRRALGHPAPTATSLSLDSQLEARELLDPSYSLGYPSCYHELTPNSCSSTNTSYPSSYFTPPSPHSAYHQPPFDGPAPNIHLPYLHHPQYQYAGAPLVHPLDHPAF